MPAPDPGAGVRIAYLILAHANPRHLGRLVARLATPGSAAFIHVDARRPLGHFAASLPDGAATLVEPRIVVRWGAWGMVEATLALIRQALDHPAGFERLVLLSGTDYPLHATADIEAFFARRAADEFIELLPFGPGGKPLDRLTRHCPDEPRPLARTRRLLERARLLPPARDYRPAFGDLVPYGGSQWWALSRAACTHMLAFDRDRPALARFLAGTACADETYFHTILGNSPFAPRIRPTLTYADWRGLAASPAWLTPDHLDELRRVRMPSGVHPGMLFARKCPDPSDEIVARIEAMIAA